MFVIITICVSYGEQSNSIDITNLQKGREERKLCRDLCSQMISYLSDANETAGTNCDKLAESLLKLEEPSVNAYFVAAQAANLRGRPQDAIKILEAAIEKCPDEKAPIGILVPVKIVGRFWIATLEKRSGNITQAKMMYDSIITLLNSISKEEGADDQGGLIMICYLYLAEIETNHIKDNKKALSYLKTIDQLEVPEEYIEAGYGIYKSWSQYLHNKLNGSKSFETQNFKLSDMTSSVLLASTQLKLSGVTSLPLSSYCGRNKRAQIITTTIFDKNIQKVACPIENNLVRLVYGYVKNENGEYAEAQQHYSVLFENDSFFSPIAGVYLANCKYNEGNSDRANRIMEQVINKYPNAKYISEKIKQSWK